LIAPPLFVTESGGAMPPFPAHALAAVTRVAAAAAMKRASVLRRTAAILFSVQAFELLRGVCRKRSTAVYDSFVSDAWLVPLPDGAEEPFEVYVNGVEQRRGIDYGTEGRYLSFLKPLEQEGRLGFWRWFSIFLGIAGTYRKNDSVDVVYQIDGRRVVAAALPIIPPDEH
jgi:hypothetical protein